MPGSRWGHAPHTARARARRQADPLRPMSQPAPVTSRSRPIHCPPRHPSRSPARWSHRAPRRATRAARPSSRSVAQVGDLRDLVRDDDRIAAGRRPRPRRPSGAPSSWTAPVGPARASPGRNTARATLDSLGHVAEGTASRISNPYRQQVDPERPRTRLSAWLDQSVALERTASRGRGPEWASAGTSPPVTRCTVGICTGASGFRLGARHHGADVRTLPPPRRTGRRHAVRPPRTQCYTAPRTGSPRPSGRCLGGRTIPSGNKRALSRREPRGTWRAEAQAAVRSRLTRPRPLVVPLIVPVPLDTAHVLLSHRIAITSFGSWKAPTSFSLPPSSGLNVRRPGRRFCG